jgi:hypothetical protein
MLGCLLLATQKILCELGVLGCKVPGTYNRALLLTSQPQLPHTLAVGYIAAI